MSLGFGLTLPAMALQSCLSRPLEVRQVPSGPEPTTDEDSDGSSMAHTDDSEGAPPEPPDSDPPVLPPSGPCPPDMALVDGRFCIDVAEATLEERVGGVWRPASPYAVVGTREVRAASGLGLPPQGHISGHQAIAACESAGKRICTSSEWLEACRGPDDRTWPYGDAYDAAACNDTYGGGHPVVDLFGTADGVWDLEHMNDPRINQQPDTVVPGGSMPGCVSAWGVYGLHGNLHEWVADAEGTFRGGFYADARINGPGCTYTTTAHGLSHYDYSTGFRCCADPLAD